jgi:hypothetical protein
LKGVEIKGKYMSGVRSSPPESIETFDQIQMYRTLYDDITDNGIIIEYHHRHALGELASITCEMNDLRRELRTNGEANLMQGDRHMITKKNPARDALEKIRSHQLKLMKEFKMTPFSAGKAAGTIGKPDEVDPNWGIV